MVHLRRMDNNSDDDNNENNNINGGTNFGNGDSEGEIHEQVSGNNNDLRRTKTKKNHRHTQIQIQEMGAFFNECPHPDDTQRKQLSRQLGLNNLQIKFWFQNKRTQSKTQHERCENTYLRTENEKLNIDNHSYRHTLYRAVCPKCGGRTASGDKSIERLRIENARLTEEIQKYTAMVVTLCGDRHIHTSSPNRSPPNFKVKMGSNVGDTYGDGGNLSSSMPELTDAVKPVLIELAVNAMEELMLMAQMGEPLWVGGVNGTSTTLNLGEYTRIFGTWMSLGPRPTGFRTEASKETATVAMNPRRIVGMLMNEIQWSGMFAEMVAKVVTHGELLTGLGGNFNGAIRIMTAECQVFSPLVASRESIFLRYFKQQGEGLWVVVDVSIDHLLPNNQLKCRKRPSGCWIQKIRSGYSKVTWVEHVEIDDRGPVLNMYKHLISSGQAFGANRWVATLNRQCERIASIMATDVQSVDSDSILITNQGKKSALKLAERMTRSFFAGVTFSKGSTSSGSSGDDIRIMTTQSVNDPGRPPSVVVCAATSFWLPVPPKTIFDFLIDDNNRLKWDVLSTEGPVHKVSHIAIGRDSGNCVTLLQRTNTSQKNMMIQECSTDATASYVIYAPIDVAATETVLTGGDSNYVALLPAGFAILPDGMTPPGGVEIGGSLLTVAFQILVESLDSGKLSVSSVSTVENLIRATVLKMKALYPCQTA